MGEDLRPQEPPTDFVAAGKSVNELVSETRAMRERMTKHAVEPLRRCIVDADFSIEAK